jgi:hypothetical protein
MHRPVAFFAPLCARGRACTLRACVRTCARVTSISAASRDRECHRPRPGAPRYHGLRIQVRRIVICRLNPLPEPLPHGVILRSERPSPGGRRAHLVGGSVGAVSRGTRLLHPRPRQSRRARPPPHPRLRARDRPPAGSTAPTAWGAAVTLLTLCDTMESGSPECRIVSRVSEPPDSAAKVSPQRLILPPPTAGD